MIRVDNFHAGVILTGGLCPSTPVPKECQQNEIKYDIVPIVYKLLSDFEHQWIRVYYQMRRYIFYDNDWLLTFCRVYVFIEPFESDESTLSTIQHNICMDI